MAKIPCERCRAPSGGPVCEKCLPVERRRRPPTEEQEFLSRVKSGAFIEDVPVHVQGIPSKRRHSALLEKAARLTPAQRALLARLLDGTLAVLSIGPDRYAVGVVDAATYSVQGLEPGDVEHRVVEGQCSCPDHKFREHDCKHMVALRKFLQGGG